MTFSRACTCTTRLSIGVRSGGVGTLYRHHVSIAQNDGRNHGDDAMPAGNVAIRETEKKRKRGVEVLGRLLG